VHVLKAWDYSWLQLI